MDALGGTSKQLSIQVHDLLDGSLAMRCRVTDDDASAIILDRTSKNLAGAGAHVAGEYYQGARPGNSCFRVEQELDSGVGVLDLDDWPLVDESSSQVDGFHEAAATIFSQVDQDNVYFFFFEYLQDGAHGP